MKNTFLSIFTALSITSFAQSSLLFSKDSTTYVSIPSNEVYDLGTSPFTFEATIRMSSETAKKWNYIFI